MAGKACIIVIWFGKLPGHFRFWERSCAMDREYADFLLVTDQDYTSSSSNIHVIRTTMEQLRARISQTLGLEVSFEKAFKACDFRPAFGEIFRQELQGYEFWGHCDLDQVFGDLGLLMDRKDLERYDKIGRSGHLTLFRNNEEMNGLFRQEGALFDYQTVFTTRENYAFDERTGICRIAQKQGTRYLNICALRADIRVRTRRLEINEAQNYPRQLFYWEDGQLYRAYMLDGEIRQEPFIYIHFQKKKLPDCCPEDVEAFFIGRDGFFPKTGPVCPEDLERYNAQDSALARKWDTARYYFKKIGDYLRSPKGQRKVWMAQKKIGGERYG